MRLFVALSLPDSVRQRLAMLCHGLPGTRWAPPENFHITLRFVGEVDGGTMLDIDAALAGIRAPGFSLVLGGVDFFGKGHKIRALWAGVEAEPALQHLHDKVESALVRAGIDPQGQRYKPHVTLSHSPGAPMHKLHDYLGANNLFRSQRFDVTHFTLYQSFTGGEHSVYRAEQSYELGAPVYPSALAPQRPSTSFMP